MKRIVIPTDDRTHIGIRLTAINRDISVAEVMRRLLSAWQRGEIELPEEKKSR